MVSVVVPVFNVEKYLESCVRSIQSQTFSDIEIILVDDGATDSSGRLCDELALKDSRIRVIHKPNGGLSDARNFGLAAARGEYICFIDSDDWIEAETLERAMNAIGEASVLIWGYYKDTVDENGTLLNRTKHGSNVICDHKDGYKHLLQKNVLEQTGYAWNKLYKVSSIRDGGFLFEKGISLVEDVLFNFPLFMKCDEIRYIDNIGSHYMQRPRTTLGSAYYPNRLELKLRVAELTKQLLLSYGASEEIAQAHYLQNISTMLRSAIRIVASGSEQYSVKRQNMIELLNSEKCREIVSIARPKDWKNRLVLAGAKMKLADLLLVLGRK